MSGYSYERAAGLQLDVKIDVSGSISVELTETVVTRRRL